MLAQGIIISRTGTTYTQIVKFCAYVYRRRLYGARRGRILPQYFGKGALVVDTPIIGPESCVI